MIAPSHRSSSRRLRPSLLATAAAALLTCLVSAADVAHLPYPKTRKVERVDTYHGVQVADPYRWLEDDRAPETAEWVKAQNAVTFGYLEKIPYRAKVLEPAVAALRLPEVQRTVATRRRLLLHEERRAAEPERALRAEGPRPARRRCSSIPTCSRPTARRGCRSSSLSKDGQVRGRRPVEGRVRLAGLPGDGDRHQEAARRRVEVGEGVGRRVGRGRLLLQPLPGAGEGPRAVDEEREPPGLLPQGRHAAEPGRARLPGPGEPAALPRRADHRGRALRHPLRSPIAARARTATRCSCATCRRARRPSRPLVPEISDSRSACSTTSGDKLLVETNHKAPNEPRGADRSGEARGGQLDRRAAREAGAADLAGTRAASCSRST